TATVTVDYLPSASLATTTDVALTINPIPTPLPGTDAPATAPTITIPPPGSSGGFWDAGGAMAAADCGQNSGVPCQLYKFALADSTTLDMTLEGSNAADLGLYFINADDGTDLDQVCDDLGRDEVPESCELVFGPGNILMSVVSFGPFYPENDPNPDWISVRISNPAP
ncbi:MAG TPA: hypothetical protein VGJ36_06730, partial [Gemmatimonadales bacterium]